MFLGGRRTFFAASFAIWTRLPVPIEPDMSMTMTTSLGPEAALAYQGRKRGSKELEHHSIAGQPVYMPTSCEPKYW